MRIGSTLLILAVAATPAYADVPGLSLELGYLRNRVAVTDNTALDGQAVRFTIKLNRGRHFHWGAEAEEGRLEGATTLPGGIVARTTPDSQEPASTSQPMTSPLEGNTLGLKMFAGVHSTVGRVMFSSDLAGGMRDTWVESDAGPDVAGRKKHPLLELRSRADFFLSRTATIGAVASADMLERRDISLGVVFALHFNR